MEKVLARMKQKVAWLLSIFLIVFTICAYSDQSGTYDEKGNLVNKYGSSEFVVHKMSSFKAP